VQPCDGLVKTLPGSFAWEGCYLEPINDPDSTNALWLLGANITDAENINYLDTHILKLG
jgi:hypothetical protein